MPNKTRSKSKYSPVDIFYEARKLSKRKLNRKTKSYKKKSHSPIDIFYEAAKMDKKTKLNRKAKSYGSGGRKRTRRVKRRGRK
ncbi:hypothetical protein OAA07_00015 [bacterium]|nr:hypothetical protein [bacterium]